jgi:hypothetical protein
MSFSGMVETMNCPVHEKPYIGLCLWCGKGVCVHCIGKTEGKKLYCHDCTKTLGSFERTKVPLDSTVKEEHKIKPK